MALPTSRPLAAPGSPTAQTAAAAALDTPPSATTEEQLPELSSPSEPDQEAEPAEGEAAESDGETEEEKARRLLYCSLCKVAVNSASQLEAHNSGERNSAFRLFLKIVMKKVTGLKKSLRKNTQWHQLLK